MYKAPKTIIISGTARNVGKTIFACKLIEKYRNDDVIAIKISSHFHPQNSEIIAIEKNANFNIWQENNPNTNKDSSRMLNAGAKQVYYIESTDEFLPEVMLSLVQIIDFSKRIIIESAAIRRYIEPEDFILIYSDEFPEMKTKNEDLTRLISACTKTVNYLEMEYFGGDFNFLKRGDALVSAS